MPATLNAKDGIVELKTPKGKGSAKILLYGATVISWADTTTGTERLFLSTKSPLDGSKPIRGGIPIIFPLFGNSGDHKDAHHVKEIAKHGFARTSKWKLVEQDNYDEDDSTTVKLTLDQDDVGNLKNRYEWPFQLTLEVNLWHSDPALTVTLDVLYPENSPVADDKPLSFHALLHNYLRVPVASAIDVSGLTGLPYLDKLKGGEEFHELQSTLKPNRAPVDSVYQGGTSQVELHYNAGSKDRNDKKQPWDDKSKGIRVERSSSLKNVVVWNPGKEAGDEIADLHKNGVSNFFCVEPGSVRGFNLLEKGQKWQGSQTLTVIF
ncbi:hypothetical protein OC834_000919 [Tilletia horrida]|uniref:Glucose-6-phosphate 1-epimerase n=1 Tax=Tilletia horrida TaxID=155126 RepID=A0AAN6JMF1_9BASI|nr:hypothetical protein OC842_007445 [Tilletia horrida]KAK0537162.1 hypothetical protein OC834_000919 [Tilletia horrida]KAK0563730.1 hypothetical protein OC844_002068 [Tilletia horrida]